MKKTYTPSDIEQYIYNYWEQQDCFKTHINKIKDFFCIVIPPPNITGSLHIGHAFQHTIMDSIIRYQRMQGKNTLWQTGMDHAGIATQIIVERKIAIEESKTLQEYGRDAFFAKVWKWKKESCSNIRYQMRRLGNSLDWERERFTMDQELSCAVREAFVRLYKDGLIYRSKRLVNWDPKLSTVISDLEVENRESKGYIWYIRYPLAHGVKTIDGKNYLTISTTRPETLLGDTGVAVNPEDIRYKNLIGKFVILPILNRFIPILGDKYANIKKGTGCVKITPAHDFNDYQVGRRHQLPMINILNLDGSIRSIAEIFDIDGNKSDYYSNKIPENLQKLDRFTARERIITIINNLGLLENIKPQDLILPYSYRSKALIEPMLTNQWYMNVDILAKNAIEAVETGSIKFIPKHYENIYFSWMKNIQDWCISRQLWWGHRIPAWYDKNDNVYVGHNENEVRQENSISNEIILYQDNDVLDTWFSSALWTFSSLGWPKNTEELLNFHPTNVIVSGFDIIFFWISRMIMMTMYFIKDKNGKPQVPFRNVYITGLILDENGQKMSKSKGNIIDPLDLIDGISLEELLRKRTSNMIQPELADKIYNFTKKQFPNGIEPYGADALRFNLISLASTSRSIRLNLKRLEGYRNFCNKLWNASRFIIMNTENKNYKFVNNIKDLSITDRWILAKFNQVIKNYRNSIDNFRFDIAANILYEFVWNQFCDWYLEITKIVIKNGSELEVQGTRYTLITVLESLLRLAHPIIPFITETIWQRVKIIVGIQSNTIMFQPFPECNSSLIEETILEDIEWLKQIIVIVRNVRMEMNISNREPLRLIVYNYSDNAMRRIKNNFNFLKTMANLKDISILSNNTKTSPSIIKIIDGAEILIPIVGFINKISEIDRLTKEITKIEAEINRIKNRFSQKGFFTCAPKEIINKEHKKLANYVQTRLNLIKQKESITTL